MDPEAVEAIRIADKHLAGQSAERRLALALDIQSSIVLFAGMVAKDAIKEAFAKVNKKDSGKELSNKAGST